MELKESTSNKHFRLSMWKSGVRIIGCVCLVFGDIVGAAILLMIAEVIGIAEEL